MFREKDMVKALDWLLGLFDDEDYECCDDDEAVSADSLWTIVNKKDTIFKYIFWERLDSLPIPECCFHFVWCQIA